MECSIDIRDNVSHQSTEGGACDLWTLIGADDERRPERDPFDLGLGLDSPDIQRWADQEGWAEVLEEAKERETMTGPIKPKLEAVSR